MVAQSVYVLANNFELPSAQLNYMLVQSYQKVIASAKQLFDKFDRELFPEKCAMNNSPVAIGQSAVILNQVSKMVLMANTIRIIHPNLDFSDFLHIQSNSFIKLPPYQCQTGFVIPE